MLLGACRVCLVGLMGALLSCFSLATAMGDPSPNFNKATGYRIKHYRAPVPDEAPGGVRVWVDDVERLIAEQSVILLDVMAATGLGPDHKTGHWRISKPREHIPGSVWLPDVGKGELDQRLEIYFKSNLRRLTKGDTSRAILIYCQADCWMSWNAVKRTAEYGYTNLYWFAEGTDGWQDWDGRLVPAKPVPMEAAMPSE